MLKRFKGDIILVIAAFVYGSGLVAQSAGNALGPWTFSATRFLIGALVLLPIGLTTYKKNPPDMKDPERELTIKEMLPGAFAIGLTLVVMVITQQNGLIYTTVGKAGFITSTYVVGVPISGVLFFKRKVPKRVWIAAFLSVIGFYFISLSGGIDGVNKGDLLVLLSAVTCVIYVNVINIFSKKANPYLFTCLHFTATGFLCMIGAVIFETQTVDMFTDNIVAILYGGVLLCAAGYTLQMIGQKTVPPERASILLGLESLFSLFSGMVVLREMLSLREYLGCALIFAAVMLAESGGEEKK